jgi:acetyl/propionyl-CoA carboxylase alpha subunit
VRIGRLLVANRGEIAVRVIRACRARGVTAVAVYSEADANARHVRAADEAVLLGPAPARDSYLSIGKILDGAKATGCDAVHPGFGFLSENADFAQAVLDAGLVWVGPPPSAIRAMGLKIESRERMRAAGVPVVPGTHDIEDAAAVAAVGFPALVKASAGGGGKGMRVVERAADLTSAVESCRREAGAAFGDATVYLERYLSRPRHIEVQVMGDAHGDVAAIGERECSLQRRHQKVIEESPSPAVTAELRRRLTEAAVAAARAVGYVNAGTVEFLLAEDGSFYFLEMNTRLQVEHPVTEEAWGVDLVALQLDVAEGSRLPALPASPCAHAIEARVYAEDADAGFLPQTGRVLAYREPSGPGVRVDSGIEEGSEVARRRAGASWPRSRRPWSSA